MGKEEKKNVDNLANEEINTDDVKGGGRPKSGRFSNFSNDKRSSGTAGPSRPKDDSLDQRRRS